MIEGVFTPCPCISNYRGSGLFPIISVQYDGLSPVTISVAAVGPETLPQAGTEFASYKFSIRSFLEGSEGPISSQQVNIGKSESMRTRFLFLCRYKIPGTVVEYDSACSSQRFCTAWLVERSRSPPR